MMVIQFASSSSDISGSKGPVSDKWCWKDIMASVVTHHCSFLLIQQNYSSYGVCHWNTGTGYFNTWFSGRALSVCTCVHPMCGATSFRACESVFFVHVQIYRCVYMFMHCAKYLIQVDWQSNRRPRTVWAAIVVQQLASQGRTHQVEHKSPLIRDSQVPLEWSAQQPITLLSCLAWNWLFYCKSYPAKGGRLQALSGWILGTDIAALRWKHSGFKEFRNSLKPSYFLLAKMIYIDKDLLLVCLKATQATLK